MMADLLEIPSFAFLVVIPYLASDDALSLRLVCRRAMELIDEESDLIWTHFVTHDFCLPDATRTLRLCPTVSPTLAQAGPSIFGTRGSNAIILAESPFQCWKQWKRVRDRFYGDCPRNIQATYFLRSAMFWEKIENWCLANSAFGARVQNSLRRGASYGSWIRNQSFCHEPGFEATFAIFSFYAGQKTDTPPSYGLLGGWSAYSSGSLCSLGQHSFSGSRLSIAFPCFPHSFDVNPLTGNIEHPVRNPCPPTGFDNALVWLEEYARRLERGEYQLGIFSRSFPAIMQFPQLPPLSCRAVTRGVCVEASAMWSPSDCVFVYSIRMRLLVPCDDGYEPNRGFETCQLMSRHWTLLVEGREEYVDGDGAIGMYPLLREGSYREDSGQSATQVETGNDELGFFSYESMVEDNCEGHMRGFFTFVPGSLAKPTGDPFDVEVAPFPLDRNPEFFFTE
jgi:uncharacterized protein affecting Mg2+/Co2+ transport